MHRIVNAVILAAGFSSRFAPLSFEKPKALLEVKGQVLIERQIEQLKEAGINDITIVVGYKKAMFEYLKDKYSVELIVNDEFSVKNNLSSIYRVKHKLRDTYICSADNYFTRNVFSENHEGAYYSAEYIQGDTEEWCMGTDINDRITEVEIGGKDAWYMIGHAYFSEEFSKAFIPIIEEEYAKEESSNLLWEHVFIKHLDSLHMKIKKYPSDIIKEFDSLEDLRSFDETYITDTRSTIMKKLSKELNCSEKEIKNIIPTTMNGCATGFQFGVRNQEYYYDYQEQRIGER
ncbi:NTP transferase domain-containing protein [Proteiniclasticum sp.]|uniref:NTP transferase domain-containing protein n=1 Tax=Proteiniclasticum sp. TaxID=2053595 RepID=UPI0028972031|nr:NTP transferase domain-containing protein [Proteiniclasticum sp.]